MTEKFPRDRRPWVPAAAAILVMTVVAPHANAGAMLLHIGKVAPRVGQVGTSVEVVLQGCSIRDSREVVFYRPGIKAARITPMPDLAPPVGTMHGGRLQEQVLCLFEIAPDCAPGEYPFRVRTDREISSLATFHVSPFAVIDENEKGYNTNDTPQTALNVSPNTTVRGRMANGSRGDIDIYRVPVRSGERLSVEIDSVRIADLHYGGSEYDLALRILDESGKEVAANDDNPMHLQDPMASIRVPRDGSLLVEVTRSIFMPDDRPYCVHIGTNRQPKAVFPAGGPAGTRQEFRFLGDPSGEFRESITIPSKTGTFPYFSNGPSSLPLRSSPFPNVLEATGGQTTRVETLPVALNGILTKPDEIDSYRIEARKGARMRVRVFAASLGSPIDPSIRIRPLLPTGQPGGVELEADDATLADRDIFGTSFRSRGGLKDVLDPSVVWEAKTDGPYLLEIHDSSGGAGPTGVYRIEIETQPDTIHPFLSSTAFDWMECVRTSGIAIPRGNRWSVNVSLQPGQGNPFHGELELRAIGLPPGVRMEPCRVPAGKTLWPVQFVADTNAKPGCALITFEARAVSGDQKLVTRCQQNVPFINHSGGDAWRTVMLDRFVVAVTEEAPFTVEMKAPGVPLVRGGELAIPVIITRRPGFNEPVEFLCDWRPAGVGVQPAAIIPSGESNGVLRISAEANAPLGSFPLVVVGSTTRDDIDPYLGTGRVRVSSPVVPVSLAEPFVELASQPESVRRGARKRFAWEVRQKSPFEGSARIHLIGLPKGVTVVEPVPEITRESSRVVFEIVATDEALLGSIRGITCEVVVRAGGQEIRQRTGSGTLRIDPK